MRRYSMMAAVLGVMAALTVPAFAGNGNGNGGGNTAPTGGSSITLNGTASFGSMASFTVLDPPVSGQPEMSVSCSQNGQQVYLEVQMMSGSSPYAPTFGLYSPTWAANGGGPADCTANLFYYTWKGHTETGVVQMASSSFTTS